MSIIHWLITAVAVVIASQIVPGIGISPLFADGLIGTLISAFIFAVVLALINMVVKPIILILTLPINILTLGLFTFVINALLVILASYIVPGFAVDGFVPALLFSIVVSLVRMVLSIVEPKGD